MRPAYFYVPKGTKTIVFHAYSCGDVRITGPDGDIAHEAPSEGCFTAVPVKDGQDGKVWSIGGVSNMRLRQFAFLNVPNILSLSASRVIVPKDLAEKDGLAVRIPANQLKSNGDAK
jgi:hypothetical protein